MISYMYVHRPGGELSTNTIARLLEMGGAHGLLHPPKQKTPLSSKGGNHGYFVPRPVCAWLVFGFVALALLHVLCCTPAGTQEAVISPLLQYVDDTYNFVSSGYV